jgi:hypothetical protein
MGDAKLRWLKTRKPHVVHVVLDHEAFDLSSAPTAGAIWKSIRRARTRIQSILGVVERYAAFGGFVNLDIAPRNFGSRAVVLLHVHMILEHYRVPGALVFEGKREPSMPKNIQRTNPVILAAWRSTAERGEGSGVVTTSIAPNAGDLERAMMYACGARIVEGFSTSKVLGMFADDLGARTHSVAERTQWCKPNARQFALMCAFYSRRGASHAWIGAWDHTSIFGKFVRRHSRVLRTLLPGAIGFEGRADDPRKLKPIIRRWLFEVARRRTDPDVIVGYPDM